MRIWTLVAYLLLIVPPAVAASDTETHVEVGTGSDTFEAQVRTVLAEMEPGGRYSQIELEVRKEVLETLDEMAGLLADGRSVPELSDLERIQLFNAQEKVNARLTLAAEDSRVSCKRVKRTGTRRLTSFCQTQAEWRLQREAGQTAIQWMQRGQACAGILTC